MKDEIGCVYFNKCSGCVVNSCKNPPEIFEHAKRYFDKHWHIDLGFKQGDIRSWRTRAKLAVRAHGGIVIGLFEKGTHNVVSIPECQVHHPKINEAIKCLEKALKDAYLSAYDEKTHKGDLRYVQCVVERKSGRVQLSLVLNMHTANDRWQAFIERLYEPLLWHSIWFNYNDQPQNTIFGKVWEKAAGQDVIWEHIAGLEIAFGPSHFGQANIQMYERLIFDIQKHVMQNSVICELYAGIGVIGLSLANQSKEVRISELEPKAEQFFTLAKNHLAMPLQKSFRIQLVRQKSAYSYFKEVMFVLSIRQEKVWDPILCTNSL